MDRAALPPPPDDHKNLRRRDRPRDLIETRLTQIWESALGLSPVGRHDDFFDLGGTSLQSVEILLAIEEAFAVSLPASVLAEYSTVERLAALIAGQVMIPSPSPLVTLRRAGGGRPLFFIHSGQGELTTYIPLARRLTPRPVYGLQSVGLQGECWPLTSVRAMARRFLPEILATDPAGPYLLAATCMGGLVAFELAQMLVRQGRKVALLGLMDTHFPLPLTRHEPAWRKIYVAARTPVHETWRRLRWRILRALGAGRNDRLLPAYRRFIANINGRAGRLYRPEFYPGNITLFITAEARFPAREDPRLMMGPLAQTARIVKIAGKRSGLFMKPAVDELARQLQNALDRAESGEWRQPAAREMVTLSSGGG
jgi:acyl carrier protein